MHYKYTTTSSYNRFHIPKTGDLKKAVKVLDRYFAVVAREYLKGWDATATIIQIMAAVATSRTSSLKTKTDSGSVTKRLQSELMSLMMSAPKGISAFPSTENFFNWAGTIKGVEGTAYENLTFKLSLVFPSDYPYTAPTVRFETAIFHPNVDQHGNICLDILKEKWSAVYNVSSILLSIQSLLGEPNNDSPLNCQAAELWDNQCEYIKTVKRKYQEQNQQS